MTDRSRNRRQSRKAESRKNGNRKTALMLAVAVLLCCAIAAVLILFGKKKSAVQEATVEAASEAAIVETTETETKAAAEAVTAVTTATATTETTEAATAETTEAATAETTEAATEATTEETTEETTEATTEETTEADTGLLENLDDYKPGDIIDSARFDFDNYKKYFKVYEISREGNVFKRISGKSYVDNPNVSLSDLRYIQLPHYNFNGQIQLGELIVNKSIAGDIVAIFEELFRNKYQIEKMYLIDNYWVGEGEASDTNSIDHNNTSAFCYRESTGGGSLSRHAYGLAIDINPQQNPYVSYTTGQPKWSHSNANDYIARDTGLPHVITHDDLAYKLFTAYGFNWGGDWTEPKDYQHFDMR